MKSNSTSCLDFITTLINLIDLFIHAIQNIVNHHAQLLFLIIEIDLNLAFVEHIYKNIKTMNKSFVCLTIFSNFSLAGICFLFLLNVQIHREDEYRAVIRSDALNSHTYSYSLKSDGEGLFSNTIYK